MVICQGGIFWAEFHRSKGSKPKNRRPVVVVSEILSTGANSKRFWLSPSLNKQNTRTSQEMSCSKKANQISLYRVLQDALMLW